MLWLHLFSFFLSYFSTLFQQHIGHLPIQGLIFRCPILLSFILSVGFSRHEYWSGLPLPPPVDHVLSQLFTTSRLSWGILHSIARSFIELCNPPRHDKTAIHEADNITQREYNYVKLAVLNCFLLIYLRICELIFIIEVLTIEITKEKQRL